MLIRMGFFENFKGGDVILMDGDREALLALATELRRLEGPNSNVLSVHELPFIEVRRDLRLMAFPVSIERGVRRTRPDSLQFTCEHSQEGWLEAAEKIEYLAESVHGHQWLSGIGCEDARVFVSVDEYREQWWSRVATQST